MELKTRRSFMDMSVSEIIGIVGLMGGLVGYVWNNLNSKFKKLEDCQSHLVTSEICAIKNGILDEKINVLKGEIDNVKEVIREDGRETRAEIQQLVDKLL
jgi:hypothetical protein